MFIKAASFFLLFFASVHVHSFPEPQATTLPLPVHIDEGDQMMAQAVARLQVFRDDHDEDHYYYVPPIVLSPQSVGAFSFNPNRKMITLFADLKKIISQRMNYGLDELARLKSELAISHREMKKAYHKLNTLKASSNEQEIIFWRKVLASEENEQLRAQQKHANAKRSLEQNKNLLSETISDSFNQKAEALLAKAGWNLVTTKPENTYSIFSDIVNKYNEIAASYGGYMSIALVAGLSEWHLEQLRHYKAKYMPHLKITLLPVDRLTFSPLASVYKDTLLGAQQAQMLQSAAVMPDYFGSTLFFNMTVLGASAWTQHLGPHLIPVELRFGFQGSLQRRKNAFEFPQRSRPPTVQITTNFCLSYQEKLQNYDRCSNDQHKSSQLMAKAFEELALFPLCERLSDPFGCGLLRSKIGQDLLP